MASLLLFANACIVVSDDTGTDVGDGDGDTSTGDTSNGDGDGDGDGDAAEQGGDGDGDGDGDPSGDGDGDGDVPQDLLDACTGACGVYEACLEPFPECVDACVAQYQSFAGDAECQASELALDQCLAQLDCPGVIAFTNQDPIPFPCQAEFEASCSSQGGECIISEGAGENPGQCSVTEECDGQPTRAVECDGQACTCFIDDVEAGGCSDAVMICSQDGSDSIDLCCA